MKLAERDERLLALLGTQPRTAEALAAHLEDSPAVVAERLADLADNGLVVDHSDGRFERTESGRRVLLTTGSAALDERIDTTPAVEETIASFDLRADEADAVRHAFTFLRYWGQATEAELVDAVHSEAPAGRDSPDEWWEAVVREPLAALPGVEAPASEDEPWRYPGPAEGDDRVADGRQVLSPTHPVYGDVKHALESLAVADDERAAARAAFEYLYRRGEAREAAVCEAVYADYEAGYDSADGLCEGVVRNAFEALPGVERTEEGSWRYRRP